MNILILRREMKGNMSLENQAFNNQEDMTRHLHDHCHRYMHHHVLFNRTDGSSFDGIIVNVDVNNVTVLVGEDILDRDEDGQDERYGAYGGYGYGYGRPRRRFRRYRPYTFPLGALTGLALLPYFFPPYPYY